MKNLQKFSEGVKLHIKSVQMQRDISVSNAKAISKCAETVKKSIDKLLKK